jgi:diguanylate cyclase (GGDEF)-like protein
MDNNDRKSASSLSRLKFSMITGYALIVITAVFIVSVLAVRKTDSVLKSKVSTMGSSLNMQMKLNMDSYLSRMETIGTLAFAAEECYTYDATDPSNDEYDAVTTEKLISDKLYSLCIMENFVDYGIVYRNNHTVGKVSNGTTSLFGDNIYRDLAAMATRKRTNDGWCAGYNGNFSRIYYVKRMNDNAVLVISFYASELNSVFDNPETLASTEIRLTDRDRNVIYSSDRSEVGSTLNSDIRSRVSDISSATVMDSKYLVSVSPCGDEWYIITAIPTAELLREKNEMQVYIYIVAFIAALLAVLIAVELSIRLTAPVQYVMTSLNTRANLDLLTGILNKKSFEETVTERLNDSLSIENHALLLIDLDNFKGVNDTLGHAYGDQVLAKIGSILRATFSSEDFLGRIGGDEFCVFMNSTPGDDAPYEDYVKQKCSGICEAFRSNYTGDDGSYKISGSIGVAMFPKDGATFEEMYSASDKALYFAKNSGKDTYAFYNPSEADKEVSAE